MMKPFVFVDLKGLQLTPAERDLLNHPLVAGLTLFARNYQNQRQLLALTEEIKAIRDDLFIGVDHEGGRVQRFRNEFTQIPSMKKLAHVAKEDTSLVQDAAWLIGQELKAFHIDINYAPVLDIDRNLNTVIGNRAFHADSVTVARYCAAYAKGLLEAGVIPVGKHFPGHGGVSLDSHIAAPVDERRFNEILTEDIFPFRELIKQNLLPGIMPSHVIYPQIDGNPAGFSPVWLKEILREQLGFDGFVVSDDLSMKAAHCVGGMRQRIEHAVVSGCDIVLVCNYEGDLIKDLEGIQLSVSQRFCLADYKSAEKSKPVNWEELIKFDRWKKTHEKMEEISNACT